MDTDTKDVTPEGEPNPSKASTWLGRIQNAQRIRDKEKNEKGWDRFLEEYQGVYYSQGQNRTMTVPPINMVFGHVWTMIPKLYFRDPYISVNAKGKDYILRSHILQTVINYFFAELNVKREIEKAMMDTILIGHGWFKYGFTGVFGKTETQEDRKADQGKEPIEDVNEFVKNEEIFVVHVPWEDILFDNDLSKDPPYDCRWIAHGFTKPLEAVKTSDLYQNTDGLKSNISVKDSDSERKQRGDRMDSESDIPLVKLWEIWDKDTGRIYVVAEGCEHFLRDVQNVYEMEGLPFSMLKFNRVPGKPYPLSDIFLIEPQILERIKIRATQINHIKRWNRQYSVEQGAMEPEEIAKLALGVDGSITMRMKGSLAPAVIEYASMQSEIFQLDNLIQQDMDAVIGQTDVERGGKARTTTRTLGELETQLQGTASRSAKRQDQLEDFLEEVCRKVIQLIKQFQDIEKYVRITGKMPQEVEASLKAFPGFDGTGVLFSKKDIQGEFDVEVKAGSTIPINKENRLKILEAILTLGPSIGISPGGPVAMAIGREIVRDLEIAEAEKAYDEEAKLMEQQRMMQAAVLGKTAVPEPGTPPNGATGPTGATGGAAGIPLNSIPPPNAGPVSPPVGIA